MKNRKLLVIALAAVMCLALVFAASCKTDKPESISITNKAQLEYDWYVGEADRTVKLSFTPDTYTVDNVEYTVASSNPDVVSAEGLTLKAKSSGEAVITVTVGELTDTVTVTVRKPLSGISINNSALEAAWYVGEADRTVQVTYDPADEYNSANTKATVESSDKNVVAVNGTTLTAKASGSAVITVSAGGKHATASVTVSPALMALNINNAEEFESIFTVGDEKEITYTVLPQAFAEKTNVTFASDNEAAAKVEKRGSSYFLVAMGKGTAKITATAVTDNEREGVKTAEITVTVRSALQSVAIGGKDGLANIYKGDVKTLSVGFTPADEYNAENTPVTLSSSDTATVSVEGMQITALQAGQATITVTVNGTQIKDTVLVTVLPILDSVTINKSDLEAAWVVGEADREVTVTLAPSDFTHTGAGKNVNVTLSSSDTSVVSVVEGELKLHTSAQGTATITVTATPTDTNIAAKSVTAEITVSPALSSITVSNSTDFSSAIEYGAAAKELAIALDNGYTLDSAQITVVSSHPEYVSAANSDGKWSLTFNKATQGVDGLENGVTVTVSSTRFTSVTPVQLKIKVNAVAPTLSMDGESVSGLAGEAIKLPDIEYAACDGGTDNVTLTVVVKQGNNPVSDAYDAANNTVTVPNAGFGSGKYTVTVTVTDKRDSELAVSREISLEAYVKTFDTVVYDGAVAENKTTYGAAGDKQYDRITGSEITFARFNKNAFEGVQAGKVYYAEVTFTSNDGTGHYHNDAGFGGYGNDGNPVPYYGMSHAVAGGGNNRYIASFIDRGPSWDDGNRAFRVKDFTVGAADWANLNADSVYKQENLVKYRKLDANCTGGTNNRCFPVTLAVARVGNQFYSFFNGQFVNAVIINDLSEIDTVPGIFQYSNLVTDIVDAKWLVDDAATAKLAELIGESGSGMIGAYVPNQYMTGSNPDSANPKFTTGTAENGGKNFTVTQAVEGDNNNMVTPNIYLSDNFTFEWEYKSTLASYPTGWNDWSKTFSLEVRHFNSKGERALNIKTSMISVDNGSACINFFGRNGTNESEQGDGGIWVKYDTFQAGNVETYKAIKYSLKRECLISEGDAHVAKYTLTVSLDGTALGMREFTFTGNDNGYGNLWSDPWDPVVMVFQNVNTTGEYTNISWTSSPIAQ